MSDCTHPDNPHPVDGEVCMHCAAEAFVAEDGVVEWLPDGEWDDPGDDPDEDEDEDLDEDVDDVD